MRHPSRSRGLTFPFVRFLAGCVLTFVACFCSASAQVSILPRFIFMSSSERSAKVNVFNQLDIPVESWVEVKYGYPVMDDTGKPIVIVDTTTAVQNDASQWIRVFPKRFTMDEKGQQTLRLTVTPPTTLTDGEYWARIMVFSKRSNQIVSAKGPIQRANVVEVTSMDVPFHFRVGKLNTTVAIDNPALAEIAAHKLRLDLDVKKEGNASFWGSLNLRIVDKLSNVVFRAERPFVAYADYHFIAKFDSVYVPSGDYTAQIVIATKRSDLSSAKLIQAKSIERTFPYTSP